MIARGILFWPSPNLPSQHHAPHKGRNEGRKEGRKAHQPGRFLRPMVIKSGRESAEVIPNWGRARSECDNNKKMDR